MTQTYAERRKIDPSRGDRLGDGTPNDNDRVEIGPTQLAFAEWQAAGLALPDLAAMREFRWKRLVASLNARDYGGILMFDPLNIRYATDTTNMQLWNTHNPFRACLLCADGHMVMWEYKNSPFLVTFNPLVAELRSGASFFYNVCGDNTAHDQQQILAHRLFTADSLGNLKSEPVHLPKLKRPANLRGAQFKSVENYLVAIFTNFGARTMVLAIDLSPIARFTASEFNANSRRASSVMSTGTSNLSRNLPST